MIVVPSLGQDAQRSDDSNSFTLMSMLLIFAVILYLFRPNSLRRSIQNDQYKSQQPPADGNVRFFFSILFFPNILKEYSIFFHFIGSKWSTTSYTLIIIIKMWLVDGSSCINPHTRMPTSSQGWWREENNLFRPINIPTL